MTEQHEYSRRIPKEFVTVVLRAQLHGDGPRMEAIETALEELAQGKKLTHWIWYAFTQRNGLGKSPRSQKFAVHSFAELAALLNDSEVSANLVRAYATVEITLSSGLVPSLTVLFDGDVRKVVSSSTLFNDYLERQSRLSSDLSYLQRAARPLLAAGLAMGLPPCAISLKLSAGT